MRFSEYFRLNNNHQKHFNFVNIRIDSDNKLFIDPTRIANEDASPFKEWSIIIQDFFETIFDLYVSGEIEKAKNLFDSSSESNEAFLGYTNGFPRGRGNSSESLAKVFDYVHEQGLLKERIVGRIEDFHLFVPDFGPDLLSDLIASLLKKELINFTQEQCKKYNIPLEKTLKTSYWSYKEHKWKEFEEKVPGINDKPVILIPKQILVTNYLYNPNKYWQQSVSIWRQKENRDQNTHIHNKRSKNSAFASKDEIKKIEKQEKNIDDDKTYLTEMTRLKPKMIEDFRNNINNTQRGTNSNKLNDEQLEEFIKKSYELE